MKLKIGLLTKWFDAELCKINEGGRFRA